MDKRQAQKLLGSSNQHERLSAARYFTQHASAEDLEYIKKILAGEKVAWIITALREALARASVPASSNKQDEEDEALPDSLDPGVIHAEAVKQTTGQIIHEIEPILGLLRVTAKDEIQKFESSNTRIHLDRLGQLLKKLGDLRRASSSPKFEEFDLASRIKEIRDNSSVGLDASTVRIELAGPQPFLVKGDPTLIEMALFNGLRNSIEATLALDTAEDLPSITLSWGNTNRDFWVSIVDQGVGIGGNIERIFDAGTTTKLGNFGMGLPTAVQAAESLGGSVDVIPRDHGGVRFEFRWPSGELPEGKR